MSWVDSGDISYYVDGSGKITASVTKQSEDYFNSRMTTGENLGLYISLAAAKSAVEVFSG